MPESTAPASEGLPSFETLAPVLDRLAEIAERELHDPVMVKVYGWGDGDFKAVAVHTRGRREHSPWKGREVIRYNTDTESFEVRYLEEHADTGATEVLVERELEHYPRPG